MSRVPPSAPLFPLGRVVITPAALAALVASQEAPARFLSRHVHGNWGTVCPEDQRANRRALETGARLLSAYSTRLGVKLWIITEADRSSTCLLLPEDY